MPNPPLEPLSAEREAEIRRDARGKLWSKHGGNERGYPTHRRALRDLLTEIDRLRQLLAATGRFWSKVKFSEGCWEWTGTVRHHEPGADYGVFWLGGKRPAAAVAWELHYGRSFPVGMDACHHCDNPRCVRATHIFPGTASDNGKDASRKGRLYNPQLEKTHCPKGHPFSGENLYVNIKGHRVCRTCRAEANRRWRERTKA